MKTRTIPALSDFFPRERVARLVEGRLRYHRKGTHTTQGTQQGLRLQTGALCTDYTDATNQPTAHGRTAAHGSASLSHVTNSRAKANCQDNPASS